MFFQAMTLFTFLLPVLARPGAESRTGSLIAFAAGGLLWLAACGVLLARYRRDTLGAASGWRMLRPLTTGLALVAAALGAVLVGLATGAVLLGVSCAVGALSLLRWPHGIRLRVVTLLTILLAVVWSLEGSSSALLLGEGLIHPYFALLLAPATVLTLWWWDVVVELDRARAVESRLAATNERLRFASDLHDLQGHHLQVIALQLELAERLLPADPAAAGEQVRLARTSVEAARQGTRELATRFRGVPLPDELANAADLLRAAGLRVGLEVRDEAREAPAETLGPVVRESTTNILKHGGGEWAELSLVCDGREWRLRMANDLPEHAHPVDRSGAGLTGMSDRVGAVGGELAVATTDARFEVLVTVPVSAPHPGSARAGEVP